MDQFFRLSEDHFTFHLQYKHSATFANHKLNMKHFLTPKNLKNMEHHSSNSIENETPL